MSLIEKVKTTIEKYQLLTTGDQVLVGVSGGPDSLALAHILKQLQKDYQLDLHIAHLNHQLRGKRAKQDAEFVKKITSKWQLPVTIESYDVKSYQQEHSLSLEDAARKIRYNFFFNLLDKLNFDKIAVGHHADDQAETVLMKFLRGAGLKGLGGMAPQNEKIIRPLIELSKSQLQDYCSKYELNPRFDETNAESIQQRNKIRLELLPLLKEDYNNNLVATLNRTAQICRTEDDFLSQQAAQLLEKIIIKQNTEQLILDVEDFVELHVALQRRLIREAIKTLQNDYKNIYYQHIENILELVVAQKTGKKIELPGDLIVRLNYNQLIFSQKQLVTKRNDFRKLISIGQFKIPELKIKIKSKIVDSDYPWQKELDNPQFGFFDYNKIGSQFYLRTRKEGDRFYPLGMQGSKKVKDFFIDQKIALWKRDQIPLFVTEKDDIFWVGGLRIDNRFKITNSTTQILAVEIKEEL
ncbi:tRNA(Ile)-lysidine synthetase [Halobacteroides halobius DSM 5150]|uniref:tRNA(Ile)-lysidine synthase n=1 Tax=Halobacteroides halobius (strain ATCC 35273 / DSM 5150 / MD-1) TaxID=748449 RepID=L0K7P5_HALHC|nr:tRNA lysidine(34) synthetase TilS [Halobacteroides halobius]AGB40148.1 tRNA(Ile)-lysidine synthetase [Halobacteroides halobius DSM 5150]